MFIGLLSLVGSEPHDPTFATEPQQNNGGAIAQAIITTEAKAIVKPVQERMPVILDPADYGQWLDPPTRAGMPTGRSDEEFVRRLDS
jgi:putative SOS response-associated peptidase YedK